MTALLVGWRPDDPGASGNPGPSSAIRAALSVAGGLPVDDYIGPGDAPAVFFHGTADPTVPFSWAVGNATAMYNRGLLVVIEPFDGAGHSLFGAYGDTIRDQIAYFAWYAMDLAHAAH